MSNNTGAKAGANAAARVLWIACGLLTAAYAVSWVVRLTGGPAVMEMSDVIPWSGMMAFFFFLATVGGGLLTVAATASFSLSCAVAKYQRWFYAAAVACFVSAGLVVLIDLGRPERVLNMLLFIRMASPFAWDFIFLALSVVLGVVCVVRKPGKALASVTAGAGLAVVAVEGFIFVTSAGRAFWHSASIPLLFLVEALVAGAAVAALVAPRDRGTVRSAAVLASVLIACNAAEWIYAYQPATGAAQDLALLTTGPLASLYWLQIVGCALVPLVLLVAVPRAGAVRAAGVLLLCGVVLGKLTVMLAGQSLDAAGAFHAYMPSVLEAGIGLGSIGFAGLLCLVGMRFVPRGYGRSTDESASLETACDTATGEA